MASVYDKNGKEFKVPYLIDVNEWVAAGYSKEKPKAAPKKATRKVAIKKDK